MEYPGLYRGKVVNNIDPLGTSRVLVLVPSVTGAVPVWARPCLPASTVGTPALPTDNVWIMYEEGNHEYPVWVGIF